MQAIWAISLKSPCLQAFSPISPLDPLYNLRGEVVQGLRCSGRHEWRPGACQLTQSGDRCADRRLWAPLAPRGCALRSPAATGLGLLAAQPHAQPLGVGRALRSPVATGFSAECTTCTTLFLKKDLEEKGQHEGEVVKGLEVWCLEAQHKVLGKRLCRLCRGVFHPPGPVLQPRNGVTFVGVLSGSIHLSPASTDWVETLRMGPGATTIPDFDCLHQSCRASGPHR